jgi:hypothetical protein
MSFLTLFSAPKPFTNPHIAVIQRNAICSWLNLGESVQVVLIGDEAGMAETAAELGVLHLPQVACNEQGTPLVSSIFSLARQVSSAPLLAYVNGDILLLSDFVPAARQVASQLDRFLLISQRWDLSVPQRLDFSAGWETQLRAEIRQRGRLHPPAGSDVFVFARSEFEQIPDFAIGRAGWDNWMIYSARKNGIPVVDGTPSMTVIHQDHDYSHLPGGKPHYDLEESQVNMQLSGGPGTMYTILDSTKRLENGQIKAPRWSWLWLARRLELWLMPETQERRGWRWGLARKLRRWRRKSTRSRI